MAYRALPSNDDMSPIFKAWLKWLPLYEDKEPHTVRAYSQGVRRVIDFAIADPESTMYGRSPSDFAPDSFAQASLTDMVRAIAADEDVSKATLNQTLAALKSFYDFCIADGQVTEVPDISRIRKVAKSHLNVPQVDPEYYRPAEIWDLYAEAASQDNDNSRVRWHSRDLAMCSFLAVLGLRASELASADRGWLSRERLVDQDEQATWMLAVLGKGGRLRHLPLSEELVTAHDRWQEERMDRFGSCLPDDPMFVTNDGDRFNYGRLRYWLRLLNRRAGLRSGRSLHSLRHTAGVQLAADGVPMNVIQSLLGHATIKTTGIYTELAGGQLVGVLERSGANTLLGKALEEAGR
jgi:site-specific recombinase XerD